jgi:hypothetical protein
LFSVRPVNDLNDTGAASKDSDTASITGLIIREAYRDLKYFNISGYKADWMVRKLNLFTNRDSLRCRSSSSGYKRYIVCGLRKKKRKKVEEHIAM